MPNQEVNDMETHLKTRAPLEKTVRKYQDAKAFIVIIADRLADTRTEYYAALERLREMDKSNAARNEEPEWTALFRL